MWKLIIKVGCVTLMVSGCAAFTNEGYRTWRSYDAADRGTEEYAGTNEASFETLIRLNDHLSNVHALRTAITLAALQKDQKALAAIAAIVQATSPSDSGTEGEQHPKPSTPATKTPIPASKAPEAGGLKSPRVGKSGKLGPKLYDLIGGPVIMQVPGQDDPGAPPPGPAGEGKAATPDKKQGSQILKIVPGRSDGPVPPEGPVPQRESVYNYSLAKYWPQTTLDAAVQKTDSERVVEFAREFNDIMTKQFIRDLVTEPSIFTMVPTTRTVRLKCAPPPEQSVIQTAASLAAKVTKSGVEVGVDARLAESLVKLFEQTERTVFLQYALFRLCEMSINSAGEFRNVFPLVVQELVRQSATLTAQQQIEAEKTKQADAQAIIAMAKLGIKRLECIRTKQDNKPDIATEELIKWCGQAPDISALNASAGGVSERNSPISPTAPATPASPQTPGTPKSGDSRKEREDVPQKDEKQ